MTTRTKLNIAGCTASLMMLANVFSKPLHIPEPVTWVLIFGVFVPLALIFRYIKQLKLETQTQLVPETTGAAQPVTDPRRSAKRNLLVVAVCGSAGGLASPLWMPLTGTTLGPLGHLHRRRLPVEKALSAFRNDMKKIIGTFLGLMVLMLGLITPIILLGGIGGLIWGGKVFEGGMPKNDPAYKFGLLALPPAMTVGAYFTLCVFVLPIFSKFGVRVASPGRGNMLTGYAKLMKAVAISYASLMDKLIDQAKVEPQSTETAAPRSSGI